MVRAIAKLIPADFRAAAKLVAILNIAYFGIELGAAMAIGSVSLLADSIDFFEDASVNFLILVALSWSAGARARVGIALAGILLLPSLATLWMALQKFSVPLPPSPAPLGGVGFGALLVNLTCALALARFRAHSGSLSSAAFLSARNDVIANVAIIAASIVTWIYPTAWPDLVVGLGIITLNVGAAKVVYVAARRERDESGAASRGS